MQDKQLRDLQKAWRTADEATLYSRHETRNKEWLETFAQHWWIYECMKQKKIFVHSEKILNYTETLYLS